MFIYFVCIYIEDCYEWKKKSKQIVHLVINFIFVGVRLQSGLKFQSSKINFGVLED